MLLHHNNITPFYVFSGISKGVMMINKSLLHNLEFMASIKQTNQQTIELNFLPHYEPLGLFYNYLQPLCFGVTSYHMSPSAFISQPAQWIKYASVFKATHSQITSSALELVLRDNYSQDIDLSSMECIIITQPIYQNTAQKFKTEFAPFRLRKNTIRTTYCLAESTMCVCGMQAGNNPIVSDDHISYGVPGVLGVPDVRVVDPSMHAEVEEGGEGELWVANSPLMSLAYWRNTASTQSCEAILKNDSTNKYIRTGEDVSYIHTHITKQNNRAYILYTYYYILNSQYKFVDHQQYSVFAIQVILVIRRRISCLYWDGLKMLLQSAMDKN